jgi:hypothetical protein
VHVSATNHTFRALILNFVLMRGIQVWEDGQFHVLSTLAPCVIMCCAGFRSALNRPKVRAIRRPEKRKEAEHDCGEGKNFCRHRETNPGRPAPLSRLHCPGSVPWENCDVHRSLSFGGGLLWAGCRLRKIHGYRILMGKRLRKLPDRKVQRGQHGTG